MRSPRHPSRHGSRSSPFSPFFFRVFETPTFGRRRVGDRASPRRRRCQGEKHARTPRRFQNRRARDHHVQVLLERAHPREARCGVLVRKRYRYKKHIFFRVFFSPRNPFNFWAFAQARARSKERERASLRSDDLSTRIIEEVVFSKDDENIFAAFSGSTKTSRVDDTTKAKQQNLVRVFNRLLLYE